MAGGESATAQSAKEIVMTGPAKNIYEIRVRGHIDERRSEWLGGLHVTHLPDGDTILSGEIVDQSALNAILNRLHAMNIKLISVDRADPGAAGSKRENS